MEKILRVTAVFRAKPGKEAEVQAGLETLIEPTRKEVGCIRYDLHRHLTEPGVFLFDEEWRSHADLEVHFTQPHILRLREILPDLLAEPRELNLWWTV